jgi:hypothetical protein
MPSPKVVAAILTAHHPSRYHYRQVARQSFLKDCSIPYKFVFGDAPHEGDWERTGLRDDEILHAPGSDLKTYLHLKDQAACRWALDQGAEFLWRSMCDTWWWPDRLLKAGLEKFDYAGNWPCTLRLGGAFKIAMPYYSFFHGGTGIWLSKKSMQRIVDAAWREDYLAEWPSQLDIGFGLTAPKLDYPWDDFWVAEAITGELAWNDPLRLDPLQTYNAAGLSIYEDNQLFLEDNPERAISIHDPGVVKVNTRLSSLERQIRHHNIAAAMAAARVPANQIEEVVRQNG